MKRTFDRKMIPKGSILNLYLESREVLETPYSFDLCCALSALGAILRRSCWIDQIKFKIYPNLSTLVVGHSGIGKDTAIDGAETILQAVDTVPVIGGRTSETILQRLLELRQDPTCAVILAGELSEFFGPKDYQAGILTGLTKMRIVRPTLTMMGGSTRDWLHSAMPEAAMSGGFYPRFLIVCEDAIKRSVPLLKYSIPEHELRQAQAAQDAFFLAMGDVAREMCNIGEMELTRSAVDAYNTFYNDRTQWFSAGAQPYAHRCRDTALKIAMISAVSRLRRQVDYPDIEFAARLIEYVGSRIDDALAPPTQYAVVRKEILKLLPCSGGHLFKSLEQRYDPIVIKKAVEFMLHGIEAGGEGQIAIKGGVYKRRDMS